MSDREVKPAKKRPRQRIARQKMIQAVGTLGSEGYMTIELKRRPPCPTK